MNIYLSITVPSRISFSEQNFEHDTRFFRALLTGRIRQFTSRIYPSLPFTESWGGSLMKKVIKSRKIKRPERQCSALRS